MFEVSERENDDHIDHTTASQSCRVVGMAVRCHRRVGSDFPLRPENRFALSSFPQREHLLRAMTKNDQPKLTTTNQTTTHTILPTTSPCVVTGVRISAHRNVIHRVRAFCAQIPRPIKLFTEQRWSHALLWVASSLCELLMCARVLRDSLPITP